MCIKTTIGGTSYYRIESGGRGIFRIYPLSKITSQGRPDDVPKKRPSVLRTSPYGPICNSLGCTQEVNLTIIHKMSFWGFFFFTFLDSNCISDIWLPKLVKNLIVLFWSYYGPGHFDHNRTIRGRPQNVVCRLGVMELFYGNS